MKCNSTIPVKNLLGVTSLHTREMASQLMDEVRADLCDTIELDFADIEFISRSFADQFHKEKIELWTQKGVVIPVVNANTHIISTLQSVANTQNVTVRQGDYIARYKFNSQLQLEQFLMDI